MSLKDEMDRIRYVAQFERIANWKAVFKTTYDLVSEEIKRECHPRYCGSDNELQFYGSTMPDSLKKDDGMHNEKIVLAVCEKLVTEDVKAEFVKEGSRFGIKITLPPIPKYLDVFSE